MVLIDTEAKGWLNDYSRVKWRGRAEGALFMLLLLIFGGSIGIAWWVSR